MTDPTDVATAVASALAEVSVNGVVEVNMDGERKVVALSPVAGEAVEVVVTVKPLDRAA